MLLFEDDDARSLASCARSEVRREVAEVMVRRSESSESSSEHGERLWARIGLQTAPNRERGERGAVG